MLSGPPIEFDKRGDLKLSVGPPNATSSNSFLVCSRAMARISPVFDRMLYGSFAEAKPPPPPTTDTDTDSSSKAEWVVDLPADDPVSLAILTRVAHGRFSEVPKALTIDGLYALTTLSHYYDATQALVPWIDTWLAAVEDVWRDSNQLMPKFLWVTWEFGRKSLFRITARRILTEGSASLLDTSAPTQDLLMPPDIMGKIPDDSSLYLRCHSFQPD